MTDRQIEAGLVAVFVGVLLLLLWVFLREFLRGDNDRDEETRRAE